MKGQSYDIYKALQVLFYIQSKSNIKDKMAILKLVFFADRFHIRNYGISMIEDNYLAMPFGPVCSNTYALIRKGFYYDFLEPDEKIFIDKNLFCNENYVSVLDTGTDRLSKSDLKALDFALNVFSKYSALELSEITHAYPEWTKFKSVLENKSSRSETMSYSDFFSDPEENNAIIKKYFKGLDPFKDDPEILSKLKLEYEAI